MENKKLNKYEGYSLFIDGNICYAYMKDEYLLLSYINCNLIHKSTQDIESADVIIELRLLKKMDYYNLEYDFKSIYTEYRRWKLNI